MHGNMNVRLHFLFYKILRCTEFCNTKKKIDNIHVSGQLIKYISNLSLHLCILQIANIICAIAAYVDLQNFITNNTTIY